MPALLAVSQALGNLACTRAAIAALPGGGLDYRDLIPSFPSKLSARSYLCVGCHHGNERAFPHRSASCGPWWLPFLRSRQGRAAPAGPASAGHPPDRRHGLAAVPALNWNNSMLPLAAAVFLDKPTQDLH